jgi:signal transduction histidine kinase
MKTLVDVLGWVNLGLFTLVALVALWAWRSGRGRAALWAALTFGTLAVVADAGAFLPDDPAGDAEWLLERTIIALLVLFPYLLYRFTTAFERPTRTFEQAFAVMTVGLVVWTYLLPTVPDEGDPRSRGFIAFLVVFLLHWTVLSVVSAVRLWRAGRGHPPVARRRMQLLGIAAGALTIAIFLAAVGTNEGSGLDLVSAVVVTLSAIAFLLGLAPPFPLRAVWRRGAQAEFQEAIARLMGATSEEQVAQEVLAPMARIVGARGIALRGEDGRLVGAYGTSAEMLADAEAEPRDGEQLVRFDVPSASFLVWTSPYAPYFGQDELTLLRTVGALTGLALDRSRLFAHERDARAALERANEVKTTFVALAAHELRTPVATIDGIVQTLHLRGDRLTEDRRTLLEDTLRQQSTHMRILVDQLLDLSRLEAEAVKIDPVPIDVRRRLEAVVATAAGERADAIEIEVDDALEAVADADAFDRIVSNLVTNALRYGEPPVIVRAERRDHRLRVAVEDRGNGVPPEFVPELFERFTRSHPTRDRIAGGTGLGLAIARSYAHAHGGDLFYEPAQPQGACFQLVLPARPAGDDRP